MGRKLRIFYKTSGDPLVALLRCLLPARQLTAAGTTECRIRQQTFDKDSIDWADLVVLQRAAGSTMKHLTEYCRLVGKPVVYELDDQLLGGPAPPGVQPEEWSEVGTSVQQVLERCDAATVATEEVAAGIRHLCPKVYVLPTYLDTTLIPRQTAPHRCLWVGWFGDPMHYQDLALIEPALAALMHRRNDIKLVMVGTCPQALLHEFPDRVSLHGVLPNQNPLELLMRTMPDVGLAPLCDTTYGRARSADRLILYGAYRAATVASRVGAYARLAAEGFPCMTVESDPEEWADRVEQLLNDADLRMRLGQEAHSWVARYKDIRTNVWRWRDTYEAVLAGPSSRADRGG